MTERSTLATVALSVAAVGVLAKRLVRSLPVLGVGVFYMLLGRRVGDGTSLEAAGEQFQQEIATSAATWAVSHPQAFYVVFALGTLYYLARKWARVERALVTFFELPFGQQVRSVVLLGVGGAVIAAVEWYTRYQVVGV